MVTLADIAARTGVSINTVSLVLRDRPLLIRVRPDTIARIKRVARELDYRPNLAARTLRFKRSHLIGLMVRDFYHPLFAQINQEIIAELERRGFKTLVTDEPDFECSKHMEDLYHHQVEGLIVGPFYGSPVCPFLRRLADQRYPVISFFHDGEVAMDAVTIDKPGAVAAVVKHLVDRGHRRIGCAVSKPTHPMLEGYRRAMRAAGLPVRSSWIHAVHGSAATGHALGKETLVGDDRPTAYFLHDDSAAMGFMRALHERGIRVPREIAVVGYGDTPPAAYGLVSLSTVCLPIPEVVRGLVDRLLARRDKRPVRGWQQLVLKGQVVVRESSITPRT